MNLVASIVIIGIVWIKQQVVCFKLNYICMHAKALLDFSTHDSDNIIILPHPISPLSGFCPLSSTNIVADIVIGATVDKDLPALV